MHDHNSKLLRAGNAALDFFLILAVFWISGLLRIALPFGSTFFMQDIRRFFPLAVLYAIVMVAGYAVEGGYRSLQVRSVFKMLVKIAVTNLVGFAVMATFLYVFRLDQFSRLLLGYFYLFSVIVIVAKRIILHKIVTAYARKHNIASHVLLVGSGELAHRFYHASRQDEKRGMKLVGYIAQKQAEDIPGYLGDYNRFHTVLEDRKIDQIIVAEDVQQVDWMRRIVAIGDTYRIRVRVLPVYNDFLSLRDDVTMLHGLSLVSVNLRDTCNIMGVNIGVTDMQRTIKMIETKLEEWRGKYICVANVHTTVTAHEDAGYRTIQNNAVIALPDGGPLSQYSREHGYAEAQRVTGPDLMKEILAISAEKGWRHYFYGSTEETLQTMREKLEQRYPGVQIAGMMSPPFRELTPREDAKIVAEINATNPDFVWVGLGAPKQERWMAAHEKRVHALMIGVGAAFDYEAGNIKRAPMWMQKHNLEWLYRLMQDPKRLFKRYFSTNLKYLIWAWRR